MIDRVARQTQDAYIFTENIDYLKTGRDSIWGKGNTRTLTVLQKLPISGQWLNLAAGDGRYNTILLQKAAHVVACDIDESALTKLQLITPEHLKKKLSVKCFNLLDVFPFADNQFDGVFCTGTLHLFPEEKLTLIFSEIYRILFPGGRIVIDFAADVQRILPNGRQYNRHSVEYTMGTAEILLTKLLVNYKVQIIRAQAPEETVHIGDLSYTFSCKYLLVIGKK